MLKNIIKASFRTLAKDKLFTVANVLCMGTSLASLLLIFLYTTDQFSYEDEFSNRENIYRIHDEQQFSGESVNSAAVPSSWGPVILETVPQVECMARVRKVDLFTPFFETDAEKFYEDKVLWADSTIFQLFDFNFLHGEPRTALSTNDAIVITDEIATKYFGRTDAIGEILKMDGDRLYKVSGVLEQRGKSHLDFDFLLPFPKTDRVFWVNTYILTKDGIDENKTVDLISATLRNFFEEVDGKTFGFATELFPLSDIYLQSKAQSGIGKSGNETYLSILIATAILILIIASINFINLSTSKYTNRIKEIGVRKALGSTKTQLTFLVLTESILVILMALVLALVLFYVLLSGFNEIISEDLHFLDFSWKHWMFFAGLLLVVSLCSGLYPSYVVSNYNPIAALKGAKDDSTGFLRKVLMSAQFIIAFSVLFVGVLMKSQIDFMQTKDLGFEKEGVLVVNARDNVIRSKFQLIKNDLKSHTGILSTSFCQGLPGKRVTSFQYTMPENAAGDEKKLMTAFGGDYDFVKTLNLKVLSGRDFRVGNPVDTFSFILNKSAADALGWDDPLQKKIGVTYFNKMGKVVGVVEDFHFESLHREVGPAVIQVMPEAFYSSIAVKIKLDQKEEVVQWLNEKWIEYGANSPFFYYELSTAVDQLYQTENQVSSTISVLSKQAVLLISVGLLSLISFLVKKRTKEMGIRKVLGAADGDIAKIFGRELLKILLVSLVVAVPIAVYAGSNWIDQFAYKAAFEITSYIQITLFIFLITGLTVGYHIMKASKLKPVKVLKEN